MGTDELKLEVLKLAASEQMCASDPARAVEAARKLWEFFDGNATSETRADPS